MNDEIDVRQYLRVVWNRRRMVIAVTVTALVAAVLLSVLVLRPTYEASALLVIAGPGFQSTGGPFTSALPAFAVGDIVPLVQNQSVALQVAKRLPSGQVLSPALMVTSVRMTPVGGRLLRITARDVSPAGATALAGAWAEVIAEYVDALVAGEVRQSLVALDERISGARRALGAAEEALRDFQARSRIPLLQQSVEETARRIAVYEFWLVTIEQGGRIEGGDPAKFRRLLGALKAGLPSLQRALATERQRETPVLRSVDRARQTYEWLVQKRAELVLVLDDATGVVRVADPPAVPEAAPVAPRKAVIIILAAILGLLAGVVLAFVTEYFAPSVDAAMARPIT